jgi:hypothetical protein
MLTKYDEFLCHQTVSTFDSVHTSAREWTERIWFSVHDTSGNVHLVTGLGVYPNRNIMDAFACLAVEGKAQYNVRASRELRPRIDEVEVGPFSYRIVEPLRKICCVLGPNEHGLSYEIDFEGTMSPHEEETQYAQVRGRVEENVKRYVQVGRPKGWVRVEGRTCEIDGQGWLAERDHSWGIRRGGGVPESGVQPGEIPEGYLFHFILVQFEGWGVTYHTRENWEGKSLHFGGGLYYPMSGPKQAVELTGLEHDFTFRTDIRQISGGRAAVDVEDGSKLELSFRPLSVCYLKGGGYFGFRGFTHGLWLGPSFLDGVKLDLTDPEVIREVSFLDDVLCEVRCGDEIGYGIVEMVVVGKYPRYGYQGY